jgi:uncharacterized protein involved in response to NO
MQALSPGSVKGPDYFRIAFLIAALTAMRAIGFPPDIWRGDYSHHADELIFGFMLVQLFGFMLKALPRWMGPRWAGRPILTPGAARLILAAQALAFVAGFFDFGLGAQLRSIIGFAAVAALSINAIRARAARTYPLLVLAAAHAGTGIIASFHLWPGATMLGFGLILSICFEVGNRIFPMVIDAGRTRDGAPSRRPAPGWLGALQRVTSLATLLLWATGLPHAIPAALAGVSGLVWMIAIAPWQAFRHGGVSFMTFAMTAKRIGFLLLAAEALPGSTLPPALAIHVFAIGGLASLAVAIATSIVRKRNGQSFQRSTLGTLTFVFLGAAFVFRAAYAIYPDCAALLFATQAVWIFGFAGYALLVLRRASPRCAG